mgnify:CR=1 FL=1
MYFGKNIILFAAILIIRTNCSNVEMDDSISDRDEGIRNYLYQLIENEEYPGLQYIVLNEEVSMFEYSCGYADIEQKRKMTLSTNTYIYSVNKLITVAVVLQLYEKKIKGGC